MVANSDIMNRIDRGKSELTKKGLLPTTQLHHRAVYESESATGILLTYIETVLPDGPRSL